MIITTNQKRRFLRSSNFTLLYENSVIKETNCDKILGVSFQNDLKWDTHVKAVCKKVSSFLWLLSRIKDYLTRNYRIMFYNAYIQPHLDYCSIIWGNTSSKNICKIIKLQKRACKIILGADYLNFESSLEILKIQAFPQRVAFNQAIFMHKVFNNSLPEYICEMFVKQDLENNNYTLRSDRQLNFCLPMPYSETYKNSLLYNGSALWNKLPTEIKETASLKQFKKKYLNISPGASY